MPTATATATATHSRPLSLGAEQIERGDLVDLSITGDPYWVEVLGLTYCDNDPDGDDQCDGDCDVVLKLARREECDPPMLHLRDGQQVDVRVATA